MKLNNSMEDRFCFLYSAYPSSYATETRVVHTAEESRLKVRDTDN